MDANNSVVLKRRMDVVDVLMVYIIYFSQYAILFNSYGLGVAGDTTTGAGANANEYTSGFGW